MRIIYLSILCFIFYNYNISQVFGQANYGTIKGKVLKEKTKMPLEYTNIILRSYNDSGFVDGMITDNKGNFQFKNVSIGLYKLEIQSLGFKEQIADSVEVCDIQIHRVLQPVFLSELAMEIDEVIIEGTGSEIEFKLDKKTINVSKEMTASSSCIMDFLETLPSIQVNADQQVSIRGNTNFQLLIDNKPSNLSGSEGLEQIPLEIIDKIELITNPSAKYNPEGIAGIVNVITRKKRFEGTSALFSSTVNSLGTNKTNLNFNTKGKKLEFISFISLDNIHRVNDVTSKTSIINEDRFTRNSESKYLYESQVIKYVGNIVYEVSPKDQFEYIFEVGRYSFQREYTDKVDEYSMQDEVNIETENKLTFENYFFEQMIRYNHDFIPDKNKITLRLIDRYGNSEKERNVNSIDVSALVFDRYEYYVFDDSKWTNKRVNIDYYDKINEKTVLEVGYALWYNINRKDHMFLQDNFVYETKDELYDSTRFNRKIHSVYSELATSLAGFDLKAGIRLESGERKLLQKSLAKNFTIEKNEFYPSFSLSKAIENNTQIQLSYSKRIDRPSVILINPTIKSYNDGFVRYGNSQLKPAYYHSFEINGIKNVNKSSYSIGLYYRKGVDVIKWYSEIHSDTIVRKPNNMGIDHSLGSEFMINKKVNSKLKVNLSADLFYYIINGKGEELSESKEIFRYNMRMNIRYKFTNTLNARINARYSSKSVNSQSEEEASYFVNMALTKTFLNGKLKASIMFQDIFNGRNYNYQINNPNYQFLFKNKPASRYVMCKLTYNINNYKSRNIGVE